MATELSASIISSFSSTLSSPWYFYINEERGFTETTATSTIGGFSYVKFDSLEAIKDLSLNNNSFICLTDLISLSSFLSNQIDIEGDETVNAGIINSNKFTKYYSPDTNKNVEIESQIDHKNQFLLVSPFKKDFKYNVIALKNSYGIDGELNYSSIINGSPDRYYDGIYFGNNQEKGYESVYLQYQSSKKPILIKSDIFNNIFLPYGVDTYNLVDANFEYCGAFGGNSPLNSDIIIIDKFGYGNYTSSGFPSDSFNGRPLCLWLSAGSLSSNISMVWKERWYDPNLISSDQAFIVAKNPLSAIKSVVDIDTSATLEPKTSLTYLRFGPERNLTFINSFSSSLICHFDTWNTTINDNVNDIEGFVIGNYPTLNPSNELKMDGAFHIHIPPNELLFDNSNMSVGLWVHQNEWSCGIDTQYFGNFSNNEGYGLFFNTGATPALITFCSMSGNIYGLNYKGYRVFEKSLNTSLGISASRIDYITTDIYGSRWVYDSINKYIYKLDTDDILKYTVQLESNVDITKMQINSQNEISIFDNYNHAVSSFDANGNYLSSVNNLSSYDNFEIDNNDNFIYSIANILRIDNNNDVIKALGINLYKNDVLFYHIGKKIQAFNIDNENNYWVVYDTNKLIKLDSLGHILFEKTIDLPFSNDSSLEINFVKEIKGQCDYDVAWIVYNNNNYIVKVNSYGDVIKRLNIKNIVNLKSCGEFYLNTKGDFTGFDNRRKFLKYNNNVISSKYPTISLKINLKCGTNKKIIQLHYPSNSLYGFNHIGFSHEILNSKTVLKLKINSKTVSEYILNGAYIIDYGTKISPFVIGGISGKLGAMNIERSLSKEGFFIGTINDIRIYNKPLSDFEFRGLSMNLYYNNYSNMVWYMPCPRRTYMEEMISYNIFRYFGHKSNKFNIKIKNLEVDNEELKSIIMESIQNIITKITPVNTELNEIIFD